MNSAADILRYQRQVAFSPLGAAGQRALLAGRVLVVGLGGLGSWSAELLARAGVGFLRLVDDDKVDWPNIHRQALYDEQDAEAGRLKVHAAQQRLRRVNSAVKIEPVVARLGRDNVLSLAEGVDVILDGTDNFAARFLINDFSVKFARPWVFAGVMGAEAQTATIVPGRTPCLRCLMDAPPPPCGEPTCGSTGVLGPAVSAIASFQAVEAIKILTGRLEDIRPHLLKFDLWTNTVQRLDLAAGGNPDCPCCKHREFEFLEP